MASTTTADLVQQASAAFCLVREDEEAKACMSLTDNLDTIVATAETMVELKKIMSYKEMAKQINVPPTRMYRWKKVGMFERIQVRSVPK